MESSLDTTAHVQQWQVYRQRWYVLTIVALLNVFCGFLWISFTAVSTEAGHYYEVDDDVIGYLSSSMFAVNALFGLLAMWILDKWGLKPGIRIGTLLIFAGCFLRGFSTFIHMLPNKQYYLTLVSQWVIACGQPFILFTPTKVAECWFPDYQRVSATTVITLGTPIGFMIGSLMLPRVIKAKHDIPLLNWYICVPAIVAYLLCFTITSSKPPTAPSGSAAINTNRPFFSVIKKILTEKAFIILLLYVGSSLGILFALAIDLEALIRKNYSEIGCGIAASVLMSGGIIGAIIASFIADATKKFITIMKISACFQCVALCGLFIIVRYPDILIGIGALCVLTGFFAFMAYPLGLELGIECSFPNSSEASVNGLLLISGQLQGVIFIGFMRLLARQSGQSLNYSDSLIGQSALNTFSACVFILFFYTEYKRMTSDRRNQVEQILNRSNDLESSMHSTSSIYS